MLIRISNLQEINNNLQEKNKEEELIIHKESNLMKQDKLLRIKQVL